MDFEQQLRRAFAPCDPRPELWVGVLARAPTSGRGAKGTRRFGSRSMLFGAALAVAAAAATLAWFLARKPEPQLALVSPVPAPAFEPAAMAPAESPVVEKAAPEPKAVKTAAPEEVLPPVKPFTVRILPLQNTAKDAGAKAAVDSFYSAFVEDLRGVPGLELIRADMDNTVDGRLPDFQITVMGSGQDSSGKFSVAVAGDPKNFLEMKRKLVSENREVGNGFGFATSTQGDIASCAPTTGDGSPDCRTPTGVAASMVDSLRRRTFPEDPSLQIRLQQDLLDGSLDPAKRLRALTDIGSLKSSLPGEALQNPSVVRGAIALAESATDPAVRAQVWRAMRGSRNPDLVGPVVASLRQERDAEVRLQAVILLQEDFSGDPRARQALEGVVREETRPLVRALASRALNGESSWKDYIVASLKDTSRPDAERIEAFLYYVAKPGRVAGSVEFSSQHSELSDLLDDEAIGALTRLLPEAAKSSEVKPAMNSILSVLGTLQKPAITSMFLGMLEHTAQPLRYPIVLALTRRASDPAARAALEKISSEDPDATLRELAGNALKGLPPTG